LLTSSSTLQLSELTCSLLRPASGQTLRLADSGGTERLGLTSNSAVFSAPVSAPSLDCSGSVTCGSSLLTPIIYLSGVDLSTTLAGKMPTINSSTALSANSLTTSGYSTMNGLRVAAGQGLNGTGANLRVVGSGTDGGYNNTSSVFWGAQ